MNRPPHVLLATLVSVGLLAACTPGADDPAPEPRERLPLTLAANVDDGAGEVAVDTLVRVDGRHGTLDEVTLTAGQDEVPGVFQGAAWVASERLEPGQEYRLVATGTGDDGAAVELTRSFTSQDLTLAEQTYPSVAPLADETVGVGMPVIVTFDVPVTDRRLYEEHMHVTADPGVRGSWSWFSDREVHYRPKEYWPAGTKVRVQLDLNSLPAGEGVFGQQDQDITFSVGPRQISTVDVARHTLAFERDGEQIRTIPVSTGDGGHPTRNGIKIVKEKFASVDMDAASTGVDPSDPGYNDMKGVKWALRITNSGEFLHAAPWNAAYFGRANMSHGCTGMSTADAGWLYQQTRRGDIVRFVNSSRGLEDRNGWTDWNVSWDDWVAESALDQATAPSSTA